MAENKHQFESLRRPVTSWLPAVRWALLAILVAAPLAFGAVQPWAWGSLGLISAILVMLWVLDGARCGRVNFIWSPLYSLCFVVLFLAVFQLQTHSSLDAVGTRESTIKFIIYLLVFFLTQQSFANCAPQSWRFAAALITAYAFAMALFGIIQFFVSPSLLYGVIQPRWAGSVFGPYVNHNHFAGLMELLIPIAMAMVLVLPETHPARPSVSFSVFLCLAAVVLSGSRAGTVIIAIQLGAILALSSVTASALRARQVFLWVITSCAIAGASFLWLAPESLWSRWEQTANAPRLAVQDRLTMAADTLRMSRDNLAHGVGLGAFEIAYPRYQNVVTDSAVDYAHNDYAQFAAESGFTGWLLMPLAIGLFLRAAFRQIRERVEVETGWLQIGATVGVCGILVHSFVDFNLHIPANAAWFTFLAALALLPSCREPASHLG